MQLASTAKPQHNHKESTDKTATTSHQTPEVKEGMQDSMPLFLQRAALSDFAPSIVQRQPLEEEEELQTMPTGDVIQRQAENEEEEEELDEPLAVNEEELEDFTESACECALCKCMNTIYTRWENWQPESRMEVLFKNHIEQMC